MACSAALAGVGCSGPAGGRVAGSAHARSPAGPTAGFVTPARWDYHPAAPQALSARARLDGGGCLVLAEGGQRWLVAAPRSAPPAPAASPCRGRAVAATTLAPEDLTGLVRRSATSWLFVGQSGTLYEAADALAPTTRSIAAPEPLLRVAGAGARVVAATSAGRVLRLGDDAAWHRAARPPPVAGVFDVAVADDGAALALAFPEALFASDDGGAHWVAVDAPRIGARRLGTSDAGEIVVEGLVDSLVRKNAKLERGAARVPSASSADPQVGPAPSAAAVLAGRASVDGDRYVEVLRADDDGAGEPTRAGRGDWQLGRGRIEGRLETRPVAGTARCEQLKVAASARRVALACLSSGPSGLSDVRLSRSADGGATFIDIAGSGRLSAPSEALVRLALSSAGSILVTGVCREATDGSCRPLGPLVVAPDAGARALVAAAADLGDGALAPTFSADGRSAWFVGHRAKNGKLGLFVSHDAGESFSVRSLEIDGGGYEPAGDEEEEHATPRVGPRQGRSLTARRRAGEDEGGDLDTSDATVITQGEDGSLGIVLSRSHSPVYVAVDEDGRTQSLGRPPVDDAALGGVGRRVLAVAADGDDDAADGPAAWESSDGGASWQRVEPTSALAAELGRGDTPIVCAAGGCLVGDTLTRVGWGGAAFTPPGRAVGPPPPAREPSLGTPIVCEAAADSRWTLIEGVRWWPRSSEAMRGRSLWSVVTQDGATDTVAVVAATLPEHEGGEPRMTRRVLLDRPARKARFATHVASVAEGFVALRVPVETTSPGAKPARPGAPMRDVEIAWENFYEPVTGHATLADAGAFESGDVAVPSDGALVWDPALVSPAGRGLLVQLHAKSPPTTGALWIDAGGRTEAFPMPPWPALHADRSLRADVTVESGRPVPIAYVSEGPSLIALLTAQRDGDGPTAAWRVAARSLAPASRGLEPAIDVVPSYAGRVAGLAVVVAALRGGRGHATFVPFAAAGPQRAAPTPLDLPSAPRPCSAAERATTARVEIAPTVHGEPFFPGTRHPILVTQRTAGGARASTDVDLGALVTSGVVLHGTPEAPCVAAWDASGVKGTGGPEAGAEGLSAIVAGDLTHGYLFRAPPAPTETTAGAGKPNAGKRPPASGTTKTAGPRGLEVRPITCRFDRGARLPDAIWSASGVYRTPSPPDRDGVGEPPRDRVGVE